ncbi:MAG: TIGR00701 family protein, partial [Legionellales bacterium]|nr:TIGR00701 family protein [Legionellales bacterium]
MGWMHAKLLFVAGLWGYHLMCGHYRKKFAQDANVRSDTFFRFFNEFPVLPLIGIVILVVVKPF